MALVLKAHIMGKNPLNIEPILDSVRNFTNQRRFGGGYSALDIALHDIAGKVYGVPVWRLIGSQYRNRVRCYCDTTESSLSLIHISWASCSTSTPSTRKAWSWARGSPTA